MALTAVKSGQVEIIEPQGRFDAYAAPSVAAWLAERTATPEGPIFVVVNLAAVGFVDSTALAALVQGMKHCRQSGGDLRLCSLQQPVRIIFELTRLDRAFEIFGTVGEAIDSFGNV